MPSAVVHGLRAQSTTLRCFEQSYDTTRWTWIAGAYRASNAITLGSCRHDALNPIAPFVDHFPSVSISIAAAKSPAVTRDFAPRHSAMRAALDPPPGAPQLAQHPATALDQLTQRVPERLQRVRRDEFTRVVHRSPCLYRAFATANSGMKRFTSASIFRCIATSRSVSMVNTAHVTSTPAALMMPAMSAPTSQSFPTK